MTKYRARSCPRCNYYVAFSVSKPLTRPRETAIISFCLNCGYKIPVQGVIRGIRRAASSARRGVLRLANPAPLNHPDAEHERTPSGPDESSIDTLDYGRHLRAIGQDLEQLHLTRFNLECAGGLYFVWPRSDTVDTHPGPPILANRGLLSLWQNRTGPRTQGQEEYTSLNPLRRLKRYRYTSVEINKIDEAGRARRRSAGMSDGHSLSQSLRTLGTLVSQRNQKLLGIAWQELSVSVVFENERGRREIDVFRRDHLYDLWVRMYLRRHNRALSDLPR